MPKYIKNDATPRYINSYTKQSRELFVDIPFDDLANPPAAFDASKAICQPRVYSDELSDNIVAQGEKLFTFNNQDESIKPLINFYERWIYAAETASVSSDFVTANAIRNGLEELNRKFNNLDTNEDMDLAKLNAFHLTIDKVDTLGTNINNAQNKDALLFTRGLKEPIIPWQLASHDGDESTYRDYHSKENYIVNLRHYLDSNLENVGDYKNAVQENIIDQIPEPNSPPLSRATIPVTDQNSASIATSADDLDELTLENTGGYLYSDIVTNIQNNITGRENNTASIPVAPILPPAEVVASQDIGQSSAPKYIADAKPEDIQDYITQSRQLFIEIESEDFKNPPQAFDESLRICQPRVYSDQLSDSIMKQGLELLSSVDANASNMHVFVTFYDDWIKAANTAIEHSDYVTANAIRIGLEQIASEFGDSHRDTSQLTDSNIELHLRQLRLDIIDRQSIDLTDALENSKPIIPRQITSHDNDGVFDVDHTSKDQFASQLKSYLNNVAKINQLTNFQTAMLKAQLISTQQSLTETVVHSATATSATAIPTAPPVALPPTATIAIAPSPDSGQTSIPIAPPRSSSLGILTASQAAVTEKTGQSASAVTAGAEAEPPAQPKQKWYQKARAGVINFFKSFTLVQNIRSRFGTAKMSASESRTEPKTAQRMIRDLINNETQAASIQTPQATTASTLAKPTAFEVAATPVVASSPLKDSSISTSAIVAHAPVPTEPTPATVIIDERYQPGNINDLIDESRRKFADIPDEDFDNPPDEFDASRSICQLREYSDQLTASTMAQVDPTREDSYQNYKAWINAANAAINEYDFVTAKAIYNGLITDPYGLETEHPYAATALKAELKEINESLFGEKAQLTNNRGLLPVVPAALTGHSEGEKPSSYANKDNYGQNLRALKNNGNLMDSIKEAQKAVRDKVEETQIIQPKKTWFQKRVAAIVKVFKRLGKETNTPDETPRISTSQGVTTPTSVRVTDATGAVSAASPAPSAPLPVSSSLTGISTPAAPIIPPNLAASSVTHAQTHSQSDILHQLGHPNTLSNSAIQHAAAETLSAVPVYNSPISQPQSHSSISQPVSVAHPTAFSAGPKEPDIFQAKYALLEDNTKYLKQEINDLERNPDVLQYKKIEASLSDSNSDEGTSSLKERVMQEFPDPARRQRVEAKVERIKDLDKQIKTEQENFDTNEGRYKPESIKLYLQSRSDESSTPIPSTPPTLAYWI